MQKPAISILTYKQLAQNYPEGKKTTANGETIRQIIRRVNKEKTQVRVVNKPGSLIKTPEGTFMISRKGKSIWIGD